jgi:hypothetical protein
MARSRNDLRALRGIIAEAQRILGSTELTVSTTQHVNELLTTAAKLADHLLEQSPAAALGRKGGKITAKRGPEYFRKIANMRKVHKGGRPSKDSR